MILWRGHALIVCVRPRGERHRNESDISQAVNDFIGSLTSTTDRASSEIRVYCENDARWVMHPDPKYRTTYAVEETNHMATFTSSLCNGTSLGTPYALTNRGRRIQSGENPNRAVVTLCDNLIKRQPGEPLKWTFTGGVRTVNWPAVAKQSSPRIMEGVVAHTIFHELAHISQPAKVIVDVAGQNSYGWDAVWNMPYADAIRNADNFGEYLRQSILLKDNCAKDHRSLVFYGDFSLLPGLWQDVEDAMDVASK